METLEVTKEISLSVLDQREASLTALALSAKDLTITGPDDKPGYKLVREKRIELKAERVQVQNDAYDLRENAVKFQKTVIKREKQLVAILSEEETRLSGLEITYDQWQEEIKKKKEREENERIQKRVDALAKFNHGIDFYEAKIMLDEDFEALLGHAEAEYNKDQERIALEKAETERLKKEEEDRLKNERAELAKQRAEQEARERELQRQEAERTEAIRKQEEVTRKENERIRAEREKFEEEKRKYEETVRYEQAKKEAAERAVIEEQVRVKREAEEKIERERLAKIEAERQESLKPDKEKLANLSKQLLSFSLPEMSTKEGKAALRDVANRIITTGEYCHDLSKSI